QSNRPPHREIDVVPLRLSRDALDLRLYFCKNVPLRQKENRLMTLRLVNPNWKILGLTMVLMFVSGGLARAQNYSIDFWSIDGGGGSLSGGGYTLQASVIGQPDAGVLTGGGYTLYGGFLGPEDAARNMAERAWELYE